MSLYIIRHHGFGYYFITAETDQQMLDFLAEQTPGILPQNFSIVSPPDTRGVTCWTYYQEEDGRENLDKLPDTPLSEWGRKRGLRYFYRSKVA